MADRVRTAGRETKLNDHWGVIIKYELRPTDGAGMGPKRAGKPPMRHMLKEDWGALGCLPNVGYRENTYAELTACTTDPIERLAAYQRGTAAALDELVKERGVTRAGRPERGQAGGR